MDRIRFDSLYNQLTGAFSRGAGTIAAGSSDRFSQVLDQQVKGQPKAPGDPVTTPNRSADSRRADAESRSRDPSTRRKAQTTTANQDTRSSDAKSAAPRTATVAARPPVAAKSAATQTAQNAAGARRNLAKPGDARGDDTAGDAPAADGKIATASAKADAKCTADGADGGMSNADDGKETDPGAPATDAAVSVPTPTPPLPIATGPAGKTPDPVLAGGPQELPDPAIAGPGLAGAVLGSPTDPGSDPALKGLKFGSVIAGVSAKTGQPDALAAAKDPATDGTDGDGGTAAGDPLATALSAAQASNAPGASGQSASGSGKSRGKGDPLTAATRATAAHNDAVQQNAKPDLTALRPAAAVAANATAAGPGSDPSADETAADLTVTSGTAASGDAEYSTWSQYLGSGTGSGSMVRGASWPASDFVAQLKQNLDILPPHEQIAIQIMNAKPNGSSRMTVDLQPAELGRVEVRLDIDKDKKVTASVVVDRPATLDMLQRDAKALERVLQDAGLQADSGSLSFSLRDTGQNGGRDQSGNGGGADKGADGGPGAADTANQPVRADVVATADGYADLEA